MAVETPKDKKVILETIEPKEPSLKESSEVRVPKVQTPTPLF